MEVVLSHQFWQQRFNGNPGIVGTVIRLNGQPLTVVGVAPPGFRGLTGGADLFVPITLATIFEYKGILEETGNHWFLAVARLKPGVTLEEAGADAQRVGAIVDREFHFREQVAPWSAGVEPLARLPGRSRVPPLRRGSSRARSRWSSSSPV